MRLNRFLKLLPEIQPKVEAVAQSLAYSSPYDIGSQSLVNRGLLSIYRTTTTVDRPHNVSYLVQRAKLHMRDEVVKAEQRVRIEYTFTDLMAELKDFND
jgi:hypothetical protein